jgi:hypothetical protein
MGRKVAMLWHASFCIGAGVLYFYFVLPRRPELMGDTSHAWGTVLRCVTGALVGLAALPVWFTLLRTRKPEFGTPQLALSIRTWSIVAHVAAGVLIIGTAVTEIWISLDTAGQYFFAIYGAAAAIAVLGFFAFYLSFVAELPPPPPKPIKLKEPKQRRLRGRKKDDEADTEADEDEADEVGADEDAADEDEETEETEESDLPEAETVVAELPEAETVVAELPEAETVVAKLPELPEAEAEAEPAEEPEPEPEHGLRNRRPTGKASHRMRRRRTRGGVAVDE